MSDLRGQNPSTAHRQPSKVNGISLTQWIYQSVGINQGRVSTRLRGNNLHILIESPVCPEASVVVPKLTQALAAVPLNRLLPEGAPPIYRIIAYGRQTNQTKPAWTEPFYLNPQGKLTVAAQASGNQQILSESSVARNDSSGSGSIIAAIDLARLGQPDAIARYLSSTFSEMGVAVKARVEELKVASKVSQDDAEAPQDESSSQDAVTSSEATSHPKRLFIACESAYSPDPLILAEPISQRLRGLELQGFQDAVIFGQVSGEAKPEWLLRVDLTPTDEILKEWSRWGDVQALSRLLNRVLIPTEIQVSALLKDATLHLTCEGASGAVPDKLTAIAAIAPTLEALAPQGIRAATVYGLSSQEPGDSSLPLSPTAAPAVTASPHWVHWLNLPADDQPERAKTTLELAQAGNLEAIAFLLTRLLNPNLDRMLATGGIRVQVRHKNDLLHIMTDAPTCPSQNQVGTSLSRFMKPLQISGVTGLRIYGRRAGQKQPLWSYGVDFASRDRLVPEATPEFAASDIYVNELLEPPGALVLRSEVASSQEPSAFERWLEGIVQQVQRSLIKTQLFIPDESDALNPDFATDMQPVADLNQYRGAKVALVWGAAGLLLVIQADWLLGQVLQPKPQPPTPAASPAPSPETTAQPAPTASPLPKISLKKTPDASASPFNSNGFTQPGQVVTTPREQPSSSSSPTTPVVLPASALQPTANVESSFPTFNSRQLDEKIALYQRYVAENGPPDVLVVGSSRALRGVDPVALEKFLASQGYRGVKTFNFGINGATAQVVDLILRQMLPQEKLPKMILFADGARAFNSGRLDITYNGIVASDGYRNLVAGKLPIPGTTVAQATKPIAKPSPAETTSVTEEASPSPANGYQAVNQELNQRLGALSQLYDQRDRLKARLSEYFAALFPADGSLIAFGRKITPGELSDATSPAASASNSPQAVLAEGGKVDLNGFLPLPNRFNPVTYYQKYARVSGDYDSDYEAFGLEGRQSESIATIAQFAQSHQIPLVFVNLPLTNDYLDPIRKQHEEAFQQQMLQWATQYGFTYRDLSQVLANQPDYFSDPSHLNRYGAYEVSRRIAEDVLIPWQKAR